MECCSGSPLKEDNSSLASTVSMSESDSSSITDQSSLLSSRSLDGENINNNSLIYENEKFLIQNQPPPIMMKPVKRVKFSTSVKVCLIPSRKEFGSLSSFLWWTLNECRTFKTEAFEEVKEHVAKYGCTVKESMFTLYQPIHEEDDINKTINDVKNNVKNNSDGIVDTSASLQMMDEDWLQSTLHSIFDKWNPAVDFSSPPSPFTPLLPLSLSQPPSHSAPAFLCSHSPHHHQPKQHHNHYQQQQQYFFPDKIYRNGSNNINSNVVDDSSISLLNSTSISCNKSHSNVVVDRNNNNINVNTTFADPITAAIANNSTSNFFTITPSTAVAEALITTANIESFKCSDDDDEEDDSDGNNTHNSNAEQQQTEFTMTAMMMIVCDDLCDDSNSINNCRHNDNMGSHHSF